MSQGGPEHPGRPLLPARFTRRLLLALLGAVVVLLFFAPLLVPGRVLAARDVPFLHLPLRSTFQDLLAHGLPEWNPRIHGGQPILSNPHYSAWYPATWLLPILPAAAALHLSIVAHAGLAFAGAWRLARRLGCGAAAAALGAVAYAGSGAFVSLTGALLLFHGMAWLPWIWMWGAAGRLLPLAAGLALLVLNGDPATVAVAGLGLLTVAATAPRGERRGALARLGLAVALALALSAVQALPTAARLRDSARAGGLGFEHATAWSTRPARLVELALPHFYGDAARDEEDLYFGWRLHDKQYPFLLSISPGLLTLALAVGGLARGPLPHRAAWAAGALAGVFLGLGRHNPLFAWLHGAVPFLSAVRYPEKFLLLTWACLAVAAALAWERLLAARRAGDRAPASGPLVAAAAAVAGAAAIAALLWLAPGWAAEFVRGHSGMEPGPRVVAKGIAYLRRESLVALALAAATAGLLVLARGRRLPERVLAALAAALLLGDLAYYGRRFNSTVASRDLATPPPLAREMAPGSRVFSDYAFYEGPAMGLRLGPPGEQQLRARLARMDPYSANLWGIGHVLHEDFDLMLTGWGRWALGALHEDWSADPDLAQRLLGAWNAEHLLRMRRPQDQLEEHLRTRGTPAPATLERAAALLPRFRPVREVAFHGDRHAALAGARADRYDFLRREHVVSPRDPERRGEPEPEDGEVRSFGAAEILAVRERGDRIELEVHSAGPGFVVAAVTFDAGWSGAAGGGKLRLHPTAIGQIGCEVPAGEHTLVLTFRDPWVRVGAAVSLVTALGLALALLRYGGRQETAAPTTVEVA